MTTTCEKAAATLDTITSLLGLVEVDLPTEETLIARAVEQAKRGRVEIVERLALARARLAELRKVEGLHYHDDRIGRLLLELLALSKILDRMGGR